MKKREPQWKRCYRAMLNGEVLTGAWGFKQNPMITRTGNRCNELLNAGVPVQKIMKYTKNSKYMTFFFKQDYIDRIKNCEKR